MLKEGARHNTNIITHQSIPPALIAVVVSKVKRTALSRSSQPCWSHSHPPPQVELLELLVRQQPESDVVENMLYVTWVSGWVSTPTIPSKVVDVVSTTVLLDDLHSGADRLPCHELVG
jgi:hypothetical protein